MNIATRARDIEQQKANEREPSIYVGRVEASLNGKAPNGEYFYVESYPATGPYHSIRLSRQEMIHLSEGINAQLGVSNEASEELLVSVSITTPTGQRVTLEGDVNGVIAQVK